MEWPELLHRYTEALRLYALWMESGCVGEPPAPVDPSRVQGPVPSELRPYAAELVAQVALIESAVAERLSALRDMTGHPAPVRLLSEGRPVPRYLDALG